MERREHTKVGQEFNQNGLGWWYSNNIKSVMHANYDDRRYFCDIKEKHGVHRLIRDFIRSYSSKVSADDVWRNSILIRKEGPTYFVNQTYVDNLSIDEIGKFIYLSKTLYVYGDIMMHDESVKPVCNWLTSNETKQIVWSDGSQCTVDVARVKYDYETWSNDDSDSYSIELSPKYLCGLNSLMKEQAVYVDECYRKLYQHFKPIYYDRAKNDVVRKEMDLKAAEERKNKPKPEKSNLPVHDYSFVPTNSRAKKALEEYEARLAKRWIEEARADQEERRRAARQKELDKRAALQSIERYNDKEVEADIEAMLYEEEYNDLVRVYKRKYKKSPTLLRATGNSCVFVSDYSGRYSGYRRSGFGSFRHHATDSNLDDIIGFMEDGLYDDPDHNIY